MQNLIFILLLVLTVAGSTAQTPVSFLENLQAITPDNVQKLTLLGQVGSGHFTGDLVWSPDQTTLAVSTSRGVNLYDASDLTQPPQLLEQVRPVNRIQYFRNGEILAATGHGLAQLWDVESKQVLANYRVSSDVMSFSPDGKLLAYIGDDYNIYIQNNENLEVIEVFPCGECNKLDKYSEVLFSPDGKTFITVKRYIPDEENAGEVGYDTGAQVVRYQVRNGKIQDGQFIISVPCGLCKVVFTPDSKKFVIGADGRDVLPHALIYDLATGESLKRDIYNTDPILGNNNTTLITSFGVWDLNTLEYENTPKLLQRFNLDFDPLDLELSPDGQVVAFMDYGRIEIRDVATGLLMSRVFTSRDSIFSVDTSTIAYREYDRSLHVWNLLTNSKTLIQTEHPEPDVWFYEGFTLSPNGKLLLTLSGTQPSMWDADTGEFLWSIEKSGAGYDIYMFEFSPDSKYLVARETEIYDVVTGHLENTYRRPRFNFDSSRFVAKSGDDINLYDGQTGEKIKTIFGDDYQPIAYSADGQYIVYEKQVYEQFKTSICVWNVIQDREMFCIPFDYLTFFTVEFSPDFNQIALGYQTYNGARLTMEHSRFALEIWNIAGAKQTSKIEYTSRKDVFGSMVFDGVAGLAFSPDSDLLGVLWADGALYLYDPKTGSELHQVDTGSNAGQIFFENVSALEFSPNGKWLTTLNNYNVIQYWGIPEE